MTFVIDALEEGAKSDSTPSFDPFVSLLARLIRNTRLPIRNIIISSRPQPEIKSVMDSPRFADVLVVNELGDAPDNVNLYLRHALQNIHNSRGLSSFSSRRWPSEEDLTMLSKRSSGRFIFASTIIRHVNQDKPQRRLTLLCGMLRGKARPVWGNVHDLYESIISNIEEPARKNGLYYISLILRLMGSLSIPDIMYNPTSFRSRPSFSFLHLAHLVSSIPFILPFEITWRTLSALNVSSLTFRNQTSIWLGIAFKSRTRRQRG